ncbi:alkaline phosphatase family protein [Flexivirga oryzae]|uniref:Phospholipase C n=1 Tax=Flexivirga oryzae TaxID=1794944 RepID=A0A839N4G8_9MICO|nr:phospholipase C [Flexivirga oryzae]
MQKKSALLAAASAGAVLLAAGTTVAMQTTANAASPSHPRPGAHTRTTTPIKHVVVLFDENVSFDHYFGTYPNATNTDGTKFRAARHTPRANTEQNVGLIRSNPNLYKPFRLSSDQAVTCDQNHSYLPEQKAVNNGKNDQVVQNTSVDTCTGEFGAPGLAMGYYDGNTVTAMWNYAQHYAMSDNMYDSTYGPSTPGALNLVAGQTYGVRAVNSTTGAPTTDSYVVSGANAQGVGTVTNDPDPAYDDCSDTNHTSTNNLGVMSGKNIGDELNSAGISWGWFQGGFAPSTAYHGAGTFAQCKTTHANLAGSSSVDYSPHHNPFAYYKSTSNPHHLAPTSLAEVGHNGRANHQYDLSWFNKSLTSGALPAVSFVKAAEYQDGHAGYSDPTDEQDFLVKEINAIEKSPEWKSTAIVVTYDDSDGWYDHQSSAVLTGAKDTSLNEPMCTTVREPVTRSGAQDDRCGPGPRLPFLVISPYSKVNAVGHQQLEQASVIKFVEQNWKLPQLGHGSFDARAKSFASLLSFHRPEASTVLLRQDGSVASVTPPVRQHGR